MSLNSTLIATRPYSFWNTIVDSGFQTKTDYYYKVFTEDKGGKITGSNEAQIQTSPQIEFIQTWTGGGGIASWFTFSKMDVITENNKTYIFNACITRIRLLELNVSTFTYTNGNVEFSNDAFLLLSGDRDNDGASDLVEIWMGRDINNPSDSDTMLGEECPPIAATQVVVFKDDNSTTMSVFILFAYRCVLKFKGDFVSRSFYLDSNWGDNGILFNETTGIGRYSSSELIVGSIMEAAVYSIDSNVPTVSKTLPGWIGVISLGKDSPEGPTYIYTCDTYGGVHKYDYNFNFINWTRMTSIAVSHYSCMGFYADYYGNLYVIDTGLGCINKYKSDGRLISRWYESISWIDLLFTINLNEVGHVSICGNNKGKLFIFDQGATLYRTIE